MKKALPLIACCSPLARPTMSRAQTVELETLFKALADRHRVLILNILSRAGDEAVCVCDFLEPIGLKQPTVSHHLKVLTEAGLLMREKRGTFAYYRLAPGVLERLRELFPEPAPLAVAS
jgi:ArsR family transcriptional regulator